MSDPRGDRWGTGRPSYYQDPQIAASYGRRWERGFARWKHERKLGILARWLAPARSVLEVACGPGRFPSAVAGRFAVALDLSAAMLREYRLRGAGVHLVRADASRLPFADGSFETVTCIRYLSHLRGEFRATVLAELVRVTSNEVIIDGRHRYNLRFISRWIRRRLRLAHADKLRHTFGEFHRELQAAGLEIVATRSIAWGLSARFLVRARKLQPRAAAPLPKPR
ncbi:MAG: class I SAM-dependent methyltransferase [Planctomycetota bacterium]